jgi:putative transposase
MATPWEGMRRLTAWGQRQGDAVPHPRGGRLLRQRGLAASHPQPRLSPPAAGPTLNPSLVRGVTGDRVHQVWSAEITEVPRAAGSVSLVAGIDWGRREVRSWAVSIPMAVAFGVEAQEQALRQG